MAEEREETTEECLAVGEDRGELTSLPAEVVHQICEFLAGPDILNLILTCSRLRTVLNDDFFWKGRVPTHPDIGAVRSIEPRVGAAIETDERLPPICDNLMTYLLSENWRRLNVKVSPETPLPHYASFERARFTRNRNSNLFHENRYMALCNFFSGRMKNKESIMVYDIDNTPKLVAYLPLDEIQSGVKWYIYENKYSFGIHVAGGYLVVALQSRAFLYSIDIENSKLNLKNIIVIREEFANQTEDEVISDHRAGKHKESHTSWQYSSWEDFTKSLTSGQTSFSRDFMKLITSWQHSFWGDFMISTDEQGPVLHVWNVVEATKVGKFLSPLPDGGLLMFHSICKHLCIFTQKEIETDLQVFIIFDLMEQKFLGPFLREVRDGSVREEHVIFHEDIVILFRNNYHGDGEDFVRDPMCQCYVWPLNAAMSERWNFDKVIAKRCFESSDGSMGHFRQFYRLTVIDGKFPHYHEGELQVVSAKTLETVVRMKIDYDVPPLEVFDMSFLFCSTKIGNSQIKYSLWNLGENNRRDFIVDKLNADSLSNVLVNPSCTKAIMCSSESLQVIHFW